MPEHGVSDRIGSSRPPPTPRRVLVPCVTCGYEACAEPVGMEMAAAGRRVDGN